MFAVVERLYGVSIREQSGVDVWHPDVRYYEIHDATGTLRGSFFLDLYARAKKNGHITEEAADRLMLRYAKIQLELVHPDVQP
jgi:Zn-dependent oligopeptidase